MSNNPPLASALDRFLNSLSDEKKIVKFSNENVLVLRLDNILRIGPKEIILRNAVCVSNIYLEIELITFKTFVLELWNYGKPINNSHTP